MTFFCKIIDLVETKKEVSIIIEDKSNERRKRRVVDVFDALSPIKGGIRDENDVRESMEVDFMDPEISKIMRTSAQVDLASYEKVDEFVSYMVASLKDLNEYKVDKLFMVMRQVFQNTDIVSYYVHLYNIMFRYISNRDANSIASMLIS